jgi:hypothetical protein
VVAVRVRRTVGRPPRSRDDGTDVPASRSSFTDRGTREGTEYFYSLVAIYLDAQGRELSGPMVAASAAPHAPAAPVADLSVDPVQTTGNRTRVRISWPEVAGQVRVRRADSTPPWPCGTEIPLVGVDGYGREVAGDLSTVDGRSELIAEVPTAPHVYVAFTVSATGAVVGAAVEHRLAEPIRQLVARRAGDQVVLSWVWPDEAGIADVTWTTTDHGRLTRRLTRAQYADEAGCRLPVGPSGGVAQVRAVTIGATGPAVAVAEQVDVDRRLPRVSYTVRRPSGLRNRLSRLRVIELSADQSCSDVDIVLVVSPGAIMPLRPDKAMPVGQFSGLRLVRGVPHTEQVELPANLHRPYWIRCFADRPDTVTMVDPPVSDLKVA